MIEEKRSIDSIEDQTNSFEVQSSESSFQENYIGQMLSKGREIFTLRQVIRLPKQVKKQLSDQKLLKGHLLNYNRKEKSLQELSKRFLDLFGQQQNAIVQLDKISNELGVERRRIYDIINILQSLQVIVRTAKNNYLWNGVKAIIKTIEKYESSEIIQATQAQKIKKSKSLQVLSLGFLSLFLHWKPKMTLDEAAKKLVGDIEADKLKTKIRRLYDIANVYKSLGILKKVTLSNKKPGFEWIGVSGLSSIQLSRTYSTSKFSSISTQSESKSVSSKSQSKSPTPSFFQQYILSTAKKINSNSESNILGLVDLTPNTFQPICNIQTLFLNMTPQKTQMSIPVSSGFKSVQSYQNNGFRRIQIPSVLF